MLHRVRTHAPLFCLVLAVLCSPLSFAGSLLLAGGGPEGDVGETESWSYDAYGWWLDRVCEFAGAGNPCRVAVIDVEDYPTCDTSGYCAYFEWIGGTLGHSISVDALDVRRSCPLLGSDCIEADDAATVAAIGGYHGIWFRGGDQEDYRDEWVGTSMLQAVHGVHAAGGGLGGTSAGAMLLSETISVGGAASYEATADPHHSAIDLRNDLFAGTRVLLPEVLVDTHFTERARLGRLMSFLARELSSGNPLQGVGIDSETALAVEDQGQATVIGEGAVSFLSATDSSLFDVTAGQPPFFSAVRLNQLTEGFVFDLVAGRVLQVPPNATPSSDPPPEPVYAPATVRGDVEADRLQSETYALATTGDLALYRGEVTLATGSGELQGGAIATLLEDSTSARENRMGAPQWVLHQVANHGLILYTDGYQSDEFNRVAILADGRLRAQAPSEAPEQAVLVYDCAGAQWTAQSERDPDGNGLARQSVALTPCHVSMIHSSPGFAEYDAPSHGVAGQPIGESFNLSIERTNGIAEFSVDASLPGASGFDFIRGDLAGLTGTPGATTELGTVTCIASAATRAQIAVATVTDPSEPAAGQGWFYLARGSRADANGPYGAMNLQREPSGGDCP